jgi:beta-mannosidase
VAEGWSNWGWKNGRSPENISRIQEAYNLLFQKILPEKVSILNPETPYWESSPSYGRGSKPYLTEGDAHDWYVWHDGYPFSHFLENIPRFMSEFGFQSYPSQLTMDSYAGKPAPDALIEEHWKPYQKHTRGAQIIKEYLARDFPNPSTFEEWIYLSQLMQARGISDAIIAHRKAAPYCMGSLFWQWNDCWPAVSWSAFDFKAQPKAMYYFAQRAFDPLLLHLDLAGTVHLINDTHTFSPMEWSLFAVNHTGEIQKLRNDRIESASKSGKKFRLSKREKQKQWIDNKKDPNQYTVLERCLVF